MCYDYIKLSEMAKFIEKYCILLTKNALAKPEGKNKER